MAGYTQLSTGIYGEPNFEGSQGLATAALLTCAAPSGAAGCSASNRKDPAYIRSAIANTQVVKTVTNHGWFLFIISLT